MNYYHISDDSGIGVRVDPPGKKTLGSVQVGKTGELNWSFEDSLVMWVSI